jgi:hypothetical protein
LNLTRPLSTCSTFRFTQFSQSTWLAGMILSKSYDDSSEGALDGVSWR